MAGRVRVTRRRSRVCVSLSLSAASILEFEEVALRPI